MTEKNPKLSILIPTRNRADYVRFAIKSALAIPSPSVEVIVSENHGQDEALEVCQSFDDPRLRVIQPESPIPMHENFELLLKESKGDWITFVGDDDAVMPHAAEHLDYLTSRYPEAEAIYSPRAYYFWKGMNEEYGSKCVEFSFGSCEQWCDSKRQLARTLRGDIDYIELPQMYSGGFHRRSLVNRVLRSQNGIYFKSVTPDAYAALMACVHTYRYLKTGVPMTWVGSSPHQALETGKSHFKDREKDFFGLHSDDTLTFHQALGEKPVINFRLFFFESYISAFPVTDYRELSWNQVRLVYTDVIKTLKKNGASHEAIDAVGRKLGLGAYDQESIFRKLQMAPTQLAIALVRTGRRQFASLVNRLASRSKKDIVRFRSKSHDDFPDISSANDELARAYQQFRQRHAS